MSRPPLRLRDDPAVARALRDDLARASARPGAAYDVAAGLARFEDSLRAPPPPTPGPASAGGSTVLGAALKGALLGLAVVGGAAALGNGSPPPVPVPVVSSPSAPVEAPAAPSARTREPAATAPRIDPTTTTTTKPQGFPAPARQSASPDPGATSLVAPPPPAPPPAPALEEPAPAAGAGGVPLPEKGSSLAAEMEHTARLRALQDSDPAQALALAAEGSRRFPGGTFAQEREAIAIAALVHLGRLGEARARATTFLSSYPRSLFAERIRGLTGLREGERGLRP